MSILTQDLLAGVRPGVDKAEFAKLLDDYIPAEQQRQWLATPNKAFGGRTPLELLNSGRVGEIIAEFRRLQAGLPM
jgi:hypothetical protein